jgi:acetyltransferase
VDLDEIRRAVLATVKTVAPEADGQRIRTDRPLREQVDLDSLDWLNLVAALEERMAVDIPAQDHGRLATLDSMITYVASRLGERAAEHPVPMRHGSLALAQYRLDGETVTVRPMQAADMGLEADFVQHLSNTSRYQRFMAMLRELPQVKLSYLTNVDQLRHVAMVATLQRERQELIVGVARYVIDVAGTGCEFAVAVDDALQHSGLAGVLMNVLIDIARSRGLRTMEGIALASNRRMLRFARQLGFRLQHDPEDPTIVHVRRPLCPAS